MLTSTPTDEQAKRRLLVVDDSERIRFLLRQRLAAEGYDVRLAEDGDQGYREAKAFQPDVIVTDLLMPRSDGHELCARLRADTELQACYIIVLTGRASQDARLGALASGADDFVVKPWDERELLARIRTGMRIRALQRAMKLKEHRAVVARLAVTMAHEINNPLTGLIFELQLLEMEETLSARGAETLKRTFALARRIAEIVKRIQSLDVKATAEYQAGVEMYDLGRKDDASE